VLSGVGALVNIISSGLLRYAPPVSTVPEGQTADTVPLLPGSPAVRVIVFYTFTVSKV
jgi:hypothetical protein